MNSVLFTPPVFEDTEKTRVAELMYSITLSVMLFVLLFAAAGIILLPSFIFRWLSIVVGSIVANGFCLYLTYRGLTRTAGFFFVFQFWLLVTALAVTGGGSGAPANTGFLFIVLSAGLLLGVVSGIVVAFLCIITQIAIIYAETNNLLPHSILYHTTSIQVLAQTFFAVLVVVFVSLYVRGIRTAFQKANRELVERERVERENKETLFKLGERVKELRALHSASDIIQREDIELPELLEKMVAILQPAFQFPEITEARIQVGSVNAQTPGFMRTHAVLQSTFETADGRMGSIEVMCREERDTKTEEPFLPEERSLLDTLADMLSAAYDRRQTTDALRASESQLRFFADATFEGIAVHSEGRILEVNEQFARMLGHDVRELIGMAVERLVAPESLELVIRSIQEQRLEPYEAVALRKDGTRFPVEFRGWPILHLEQQARVTVIRDLTERKKAEAQLSESEERYRGLIESARDAIYTVSTDGTITSLNPAFEAILGWARDEWLGKKFSDLIHPSDLPRALEMFARVLTGEAANQIELRVKNKSGGYVIGEFVSVPQLKNDRVIGLLGVARDVTERKQMEEQLRRTQRLDSLGALAGGIAHDLNNVLAPILLSVEVLQRHFLDASQKKIIESLGQSARRGKEIVKQVLTFARGSDHSFAPQNARYLIREIESFINNSFPKNISVQVKLPKGLHSVLGDSTQLHQILLNLCVNARDAMPRGGILGISARNVRVDEAGARTVTLPRPGDYVLMTVSDTGTGIPLEIREKIFEPFFTTKDIGKGTGLGLSTVYSIVRDHKGAMELESEVGKGTQFLIYLPALLSTTEGQEEEKEKDLPKGKAECILVVDDELSVLHITRETLEVYGYRVLTALDGAEALTILAGQPKGSVSLVLTNMHMPRIDGVGTIQLLRKHDPRMKIIVTSGLLGQDPPKEIAGLQIQGYITKPYTAEQLLFTLRAVLNEN